MKSLRTYLFIIVLIPIALFFTNCKESVIADPAEDCQNKLAVIEEEIRNRLDTIKTDTDFTLVIKSEGGNLFLYSRGNSSESVFYRSASTSKLVTAAVILSLVKDNVLSLEDHPQDYIPQWPIAGNLSAITLKHLLNFTSGLANEPFCINLPNSDFEQCVYNIAAVNDSSKFPGEEFYYSSAHLQVAGLMAIKASGSSSWQNLFDNFKSKTGLFPSSNYDLPSLQNPRLAGGMHWNAKEYFDFLEKLYNLEILSPELIAQMTRDQINGAAIGYSPAVASIGEDWHYGFGNWIECRANPNNCTLTTRISSPGSYGAYPFIDYQYKYYGILAREGALGSFNKGYKLFESVSMLLEEWASIKCNQ